MHAMLSAAATETQRDTESWGNTSFLHVNPETGQTIKAQALQTTPT